MTTQVEIDRVQSEVLDRLMDFVDDHNDDETLTVGWLDVFIRDGLDEGYRILENTKRRKEAMEG